MKITGDKISDRLEKIDRFMDTYGPSFVNNLVNCATKVCIGVYRFFYGDVIQERRENAFLKHYWTYIDNKDTLTCVLRLIPVVGSVVIWAKEKFKNEPEPEAPRRMSIDMDEPESVFDVHEGGESVDYEFANSNIEE